MRAGGPRAGETGCPVSGASGAAWPPPGFRNIFPELPPPPAPGPVEMAKRQRLAALARAMLSADPMNAAGDNPAIPAGYTYLMQFVAHDIVRTETPLWGLGRIADATRDLTVSRLRLDGLYGGGPANCPFAYAAGNRANLRIAPISPDPLDAGAAPPLRDIPRGRLDPLPPHWPKNRPPPLDEALLADVRNDDNSNVSQVTVLFSAFHNAIVAALAAAGAKPALLFATAREAATLAYRRILREDLLKRLLLPAVHALYMRRDTQFLDTEAGGAMPLEFCAGAYRCGHAMVRESYRVNDGPERDLEMILRATSGGGAGAMPLSRAWVVRWSRFFDMGDPALPAPNASRRLRPQHSPGLLDTRFFDVVDETGKVGLIYRDLLVAGIAGLHPVATLWGYLAAKRPALAASACFAGDARRHAALRDWMVHAGLPETDAEALASDPPLPFYVLFEAEEEGKGLSLGTLGSVIVAEAMLGIMARDPLPSEADDGTEAALQRLAVAAGAPPGALAPIAGIADMPALVRFAAGAPGIGAADPAFI